MIKRWQIEAGVCILLAAGLLSVPSGAFAVDNPVAPVADAFVFKFCGEYYIMGIRTEGKAYRSRDLVHWYDACGQLMTKSPGMNQGWETGYSLVANPNTEDISNDVYAHIYAGGVHHLYENGIRYYQSPGDVTGYYQLIAKNFSPGIDPYAFCDRDGSYYFYSMVNVSPEQDSLHWGNNIWVQRMKSPGELTGKRKRLLWAEPERGWEVQDYRVVEGPHVIVYRDRYYLFYNANHTLYMLGNYAIGVVEAEGPEKFSVDRKYPDPLLKDNWSDLISNMTALVPAVDEVTSAEWLYSTKPPGPDWMKNDFEARGWKKGRGGFGNVAKLIDPPAFWRQSRVFPEGTHIKADALYLRRIFDMSVFPEKSLALLVRFAGKIEIFLNGKSIYTASGKSQPKIVRLPDPAKALLRNGENCLAVRCQRPSESLYVDVGLYGLKTDQPMDYIYNCGQPCAIRGPNGFEWWMSYFGIWNGGRHAQGIDRILFHDRNVTIDGPTSAATPGYHPAPANPTFSDFFDGPGLQWEKTGDFNLKDGLLLSGESGDCLALIKAPAAAHYLFEADVRPGEGAGEAGLVIYAEGQDYVRIGLDRQTGQPVLSVMKNGKLKKEPLKLPGSNRCTLSAMNHFRIERNGSRVTIELDEMRLATALPIPFAGAGLPGIFSTGASAAWDGVLYTIGWDEHGSLISGWGDSRSGLKSSGEWDAGSDGISQSLAGEGMTFKGDALSCYEFSVQVYSRGEAGFIPVFCDEQNAVFCRINREDRQLITRLVRNGKEDVRTTGLDLRSDSDGVNLRVVRRDGKLRIFADNNLVETVDDQWSAAQVGLYTSRTGARFDGIQFFHLPEE